MNKPKQRSTEEILRQSEERYKAFIANSTEGIWRFELDKPIRTTLSVKTQIARIFKYSYLAECNDAMAKMYGFNHAEEIIGARLPDLMIPQEQANIDYLTAFIHSGYKLTGVETHERDKNGTLHIFENNLIGIVEGDYVLRAWGTQRDITKQKHAEERKAFLEKVSNTLAVSLDQDVTLQHIAKLLVPYLADYCRIAIVDKDLSIKELTVSHQDPTKVSLVEALFDTYKNLPKATHGIPSLLKNGKPEIIERVDKADLKEFKNNQKLIKIIKELKLRSYIGVPLIARGKVLGAMTLSSIKENRYYTNEDLLYLEEIAQRVALTLDNIRLYKEAQDAITLRDDFISVASHELKTPVTSVKIYTQTLQKLAKKSKDVLSENSLEKMNRQIDKLTDLIYNLLDISKIQTGRMEYTMKKFFFDDMVIETVEMMQQMYTHKLIVKGTTKAEIYGDEERLNQVLSNLINNAVKYSPASDKIIISLSKKRKEIKVSIHDFGIGMNNAYLEKIFDRFYRITEQHDRTFPGLGIGLYISKEIIDRHEGKLWVESKEGKGSVFHFTIPIKE